MTDPIRAALEALERPEGGWSLNSLLDAVEKAHAALAAQPAPQLDPSWEQRTLRPQEAQPADYFDTPCPGCGSPRSAGPCCEDCSYKDAPRTKAQPAEPAALSDEQIVKALRDVGFLMVGIAEVELGIKVARAIERAVRGQG